MVLTTQTTRIAYLTETYYAGGKAGAKYACTPVSAGDVLSLTVMNMMAADVDLALPEVERKYIKPPSVLPGTRVVFNQGYRYKEFTYEQFIQNTTWATAMKNMTALAVSYLFHCEIPGENGVYDYFDICGCILTKYEIVHNEGDFPTERLTFLYYDVVDSVAVTSLGGLSETTPSTHATMSFSINTVVHTQVISATLTITNNLYDKKVATKYLRADPIIISQDAEFTAKFLDASGVMGDSMARNATLVAVNAVALVIIYYGSNYITLPKMAVDKENIGRVPGEIALYEHEITMVSAGVNTMATA